MAAELIRKAIAESPVIIFSKTYCPYCTKAKAALDSVGAKYTTIELDTYVPLSVYLPCIPLIYIMVAQMFPEEGLGARAAR